MNQGLRVLLDEGVAAGAFGVGAAWVALDGRPVGCGYTAGADAQTLWDVASLTKPMAVVTETMRGVEAGLLALDEPVTYPPGLETTVRDLLAHRSGLPAWDDLWRVAEGLGEDWVPGSEAVREAVAARIGGLAGTQEGTCYSDLGFISLGWHLERRLKTSLDALVPRWRWGVPAGTPDHARCVPTGRCERRGRRAVGEVDDLNCWVLGGVAGHAGLFATLAEVGEWALDLANAAAGRGGVIDGGIVREFWAMEQRRRSTWVLGWDTPTPPNSTGGTRVSATAVGHLGFTGTSVWIDRAQDLVTVLLSNRPALGSPSKTIMRAFRPRFHDAVRDLLGR
jgi:serine-type D-Ala-D-Ala carboxypeptidase